MSVDAVIQSSPSPTLIDVPSPINANPDTELTDNNNTPDPATRTKVDKTKELEETVASLRLRTKQLERLLAEEERRSVLLNGISLFYRFFNGSGTGGVAGYDPSPVHFLPTS